MIKMLLTVIVKTCSDKSHTIGQKSSDLQMVGIYIFFDNIIECHCDIILNCNLLQRYEVCSYLKRI